jgi:hypothetical protein
MRSATFKEFFEVQVEFTMTYHYSITFKEFGCHVLVRQHKHEVPYGA